MGSSRCPIHSYEDPWRASDFWNAFMQLLLTVLVLVHTAIVCITCQLMKWYGWGHPSFHDSEYQKDALLRSTSSAVEKPFTPLDFNSSRNNLLTNTKKFLKRTRSEDWEPTKNRSLVDPKCHGRWKGKQGLSFRYGKAASFQYREMPTSSIAANSPSGRFSHVEVGITSSSSCGPKACIVNKPTCSMASCLEHSGSTQKFTNGDWVSNTCDDVNEAGHGMLNPETANSNGDICDTSGRIERCMNSPAHETPGLGKEEVVEANSLREGLQEVGSSSNEPRTNALRKVSLKSAGSEINLERSELTPHVQKEIHEDVTDEDVSAVLRKKGDSGECSFESMITCSQDDQVFTARDDCKNYDSEVVIKGLKDAILREQKKLCALYAELEVERISSETAANEAMSMISRLQEEKAALRMQAAHYRRIAEERAIYDEQAMQLLKDILVKKEKDNFLLERELKAMRAKFCRDAGKFFMKKPGIHRRSFSVKGQRLLSLKNEEVDGVHDFGTKSKGRMGKAPSPSPSEITEEQPFKRLKGIVDCENEMPQRSFECQHSVGVTSCNDTICNIHAKAFIQGIAKTSEDENMLSQHEVASGVTGGSDEPLDGLLMVPTTNLFRAVESVHEFCWSHSSGNQVTLAEGTEEDFAKDANEVNQSIESSKEERKIACPDNAANISVDTFAPCASDKVSSTVAACAEETQDVSSTDILQFPNMVWKDKTMMDLQAAVQAFQVEKLSWTCPSPLNQKGSGLNNLEEHFAEESCVLSM